MKRSLQGAMIATAFIATQVLAGAGCNAILGNGYGVDDGTNGGLGPGGGGGEGGSGGGEGGSGGGDGMPSVDGSVTDGTVNDVNTGDVNVGSCPRSICPVVLATVGAPQRIAVNNAIGAVYFTTATSVERVDISGSNRKTVSGLPAVISTVKRAVAVSGTGIPYVTVPARGAVKCASDLGSCTPMSPMGFVGNAGDSSSIAVDAASIYVGIFNDTSNTGGGIFQTTDLNGSAPTSLNLSDRVLDVQVGLPAGTAFYRTSTMIRRTKLNQPTPVTVADFTTSPPVAFATVGTSLVVATAHELHTCTLSGAGNCGTITDYTATIGTISAVALDAGKIVWAEAGAAGSIHRCDFLDCQGNNELLADSQSSPIDLAVDGTSIYWVNAGGVMVTGAIMKLAK